MTWKLIELAEWLLFRRQAECIIDDTTERVGTDLLPNETDISVQAIRSSNCDSFLQAELLFTKQLDPDQEIPDEIKGPTLTKLHRVQTDLEVIQNGDICDIEKESAVINVTELNRFVEQVCATKEPAAGGSESLMRGSREKAKILTTCAKMKTYSKNLFRALVRQSYSCHHTENQHEVRLMLPRLEDHINEPVLQLDMFLASPKGEQWHEIKCKTPSVALNADGQPWAVCELVDTIHSHGTYIHLHFNGEEDDHVLPVDDREPQQRSRNTPMKSLTQIVDLGANNTCTDSEARMNQPDERATRLLTLAFALLYFSKKSWPRRKWSSSNIFPTFEIDGYNNLYLSSFLSEPEPYPVLSSEPAAVNPYFLSFARLLWETESGSRDLPTAMWNDQPSIYFGLHKAISSTTTQARQEVKEVIIACLSMGNLPDDKGIRREFIYDKIVLPLWNIAKPPRVSRPINKRQQVEKPQEEISDRGTVVLYDIQDTPGDESIISAANQFTGYLDDFAKVHVPIISRGIQDSGHSDRIKVAIIDSGVVLRANWLERAKRDRRFVEGRCWIDGRDLEDFGDSFGHGTHIAQQLITAAPNAAIYVAKIADGKVINRDETGVIAKAIEYAVDVWKVDIISLSLGLEAPDTRIGEAIGKAAKSSTLVFAAAGNHGIHRYQAWPAYRDDVIGINAADGNGGLARRFNPLPIPNRPNFTTLGVGTRSTWRGDEVRRSGTSFAVPIAVAIAANMLEYSRRHKLDSERRLYSVPMMERLLKSVSRQIDGFHFLMPWLAVCKPAPCYQGSCPKIHCSHCDQRLRAVFQGALCGPPLA